MKNNLIILEEVSTRPRIKSLQEQVNNSTLVKPKETEKFFEDKSSDKNQNKDCELFKKRKTRKGLQSVAVKSWDRVLMLQETKLAAGFEREIKDILD